MELPQNAVPMSAEQRAELKRLAEVATPGPWISKPDWLPALVVVADPRPGFTDDVLYLADCRAFSTLLPGEANAAYIAAVSPDVALATLAYVEHLEARAATAEAQLQGARGELANQKQRHVTEVLDILRDMRLPRLPLPPEDNWEQNIVCGQNIERQAINDYCRQKAFEYAPQGIGPDPTQPGQWDTTAPPSEPPQAPGKREGVARE